MASSNRHSWPSMFKTKSCVNSTTHHPNWIHHDNNNINNNINSNASQNSCPLSSSGGGEERAPEPKPRWNPRPEQIRILEAIFNSGTVNPSRDEIRKIRSQLQEYGQVGDANVFYWFQNRKSRSKHKQQRHLINNNQKPPKSLPQPPPPPPPPPSSPIFSISSSLPPPAVEKCTPPPFLQNHENDFLKAPFFPILSQGFNSSFPGHHESHQFLDESSFLLSDFLLGFTTASTKNINAELEEKMMMMKMQQQLLSYSSGANNSTTVSSSTISGANQMNVSSTSFSALSAIHHTHQGACGGVGETCIMSTPPPPIKSSIIFINDVAYEVAMGPFNVREAFGDDAILIHSNGQPVITNEWGVALEPLQHGAFYYLIRTLPPPSPLDTTTTLTNLV